MTAPAKWTPLPWAVYDSDDKRIGCKIRAPERVMDGATVGPAIATLHQHFGWEETRANARRIVACVSACAGLPDPGRDVAEMRECLRELAALDPDICEDETLEAFIVSARTLLDRQARAGGRE